MMWLNVYLVKVDMGFIFMMIYCFGVTVYVTMGVFGIGPPHPTPSGEMIRRVISF